VQDGPKIKLQTFIRMFSKVLMDILHRFVFHKVVQRCS